MTKNIPHRIRKLIPVVLAVFFVVGPAATVIAGNTTDSPPITLTVNNGSSNVDIRQNRPRLYLTDERMALLRSKCCLDENGNVIAGCTPTDDWTEFKELIDRGISYPTQAWHWALIYMMNHDPSYAQEAINQTMDAIINAPRDGFNKNYLNANDVIRRVTLVYDWLYDLLTPQQRATMRDYVNMLLTEIWNPFDNETNTWSGWGINNPGNNFYYEFILCTTLAGIAFAYDNPNPPTLPFNGTDYTDILEFLDAKLNQQAIPEWLNLHGRGGGWHEGSHYMLTALRKFYEALLVLRDAGGTDYFTTLNFPRENTLFQIYIIQPGRKVVSPGGDMAMDAAGSINAYERQVWYLLADGLQGTPESEYIEYVIHNVPVTPSFNYQVTWAHRFLLYNPNLPMRNFNQLPLSYFANGLGWVNSRSSWADDAVCVTFNSSEKRQGHQHFDQNSFIIYKEDWQAVDPVVYSNGGLISATGAHNTIIVDGTEQRGDPGCEGDGTGAIIKYQAGPGYTYAVGDASDAYHVNPPYESTSKLNVFLRELVHVKPDFVVVYDRITPIDPNYDIEYRLHTKLQPTVQGNLVTSTNNTGKIFQMTLLPADYDITVVDESNEYQANDPANQYRIELRPVTRRPNRQFLNVLYAASSSVQTMPPVEPMTSANGNMTGAKIRVGTEDAVLMFSTNPSGTPPDGEVMFEIGLDLNSIQYLFDLYPNTPYSVALVRQGDRQQVVVKQDENGMETSDQGVLIFDARELPSASRPLISMH